MKRKARFFLFAGLYWMFSLAQACTCEPGLLGTVGIQAAKEVFIFRLVSARALPGRTDDVSGPHIEGEIEIVDRLRGHGSVRKIRFSTASCCGVRLDVGTYFAGFGAAHGPVFKADSGNVVEVGARRDVQQARNNIHALLRGERRLDDVFPKSARERTDQQIVPPPCPRADAGGRR
ncbi:hypothetical protein [Massilia brevitalea]|uniref:hypothetical protein n=1 Tax=Massilia brevitalea TaxID=442526 RepID=UPI002739B2DC|nr:hypothetical protein [Massilia brevitalea]